MAPFDFAASGDATLLDENLGNLTLGLLKINCHSADDVDEGVDPDTLTGIGNPRGVADARSLVLRPRVGALDADPSDRRSAAERAQRDVPC